MTIRKMTKDDIPRILEMVRAFVNEFPIYLEVLGEAKHAGRILELSIIHGVTFVVEHAPTRPAEFGAARLELVGFLCAFAAVNPISGFLICEELAWWMEPAHRGSSAGPKLLRSLEDWARQKGCRMVKMVAPDESPEVARHYVKRGYQAAETAYFKLLE